MCSSALENTYLFNMCHTIFRDFPKIHGGLMTNWACSDVYTLIQTNTSYWWPIEGHHPLVPGPFCLATARSPPGARWPRPAAMHSGPCSPRHSRWGWASAAACAAPRECCRTLRPPGSAARRPRGPRAGRRTWRRGLAGPAAAWRRSAGPLMAHRHPYRRRRWGCQSMGGTGSLKDPSGRVWQEVPTVSTLVLSRNTPP